MNNNRFRFRVWMHDHKEYLPDNAIDDYKLDNKGRLWYCGMTPHIVNNCIIEQCTGVKDKNGTLVFEGDVINISKTPVTLQTFFAGLELGLDPTEIEIIGNIHKEK